nr:metallophosphoesterase family protein [uncultured Sphaerochaeta sp.]
MKLAVIGDIHGNVRALEAVLTDVKACGVNQILFLGDLVFMGLDPQLCFDLLMEQKPAVLVKGNTDANLEKISSYIANTPFEKHMLKLMKYTSIRMHETSKKTIAEFAPTKRLELEQHSILCCHGTPFSDTEGILANEPFSPAMAKMVSEEKLDIVFSGHTHIPADFMRDGVRFINPGAVGYSFDGDVRASYALVTLEDGSIRCQHRRLEYDVKRYAMEVEHAMEGFVLFERLLYALQNGKPIRQ